ncbi:hypothetical protein ASG29_01355 [Sphingomonas sp. Leaf412]|uniref:PEPxxWA-CTERM sorting domain-containing protein n=1 Tax=Sphingomonas sp. Leaf412 TaxID=1736370 RepID=UPI0006F35D80|nr:PEPxxWA-CTERM sorting domain-containing protein [Sphingomonas sp. Leaf412]KQT34833.1 hypothetical protein ASG29_01355 [Sphingomonas sp. Leaf412]
MKHVILAGLVAASIAAPSVASAQAVIDNGTIRLGVSAEGQLNNGGFGVFDIRNNVDGTRAGCACEGWGVANAGTGVQGYANNASGISNLTLDSFTSTGSTAVSNTSLTSGGLSITHSFSPSIAADLYQVDVTITNTSGAAMTGNLLYRRLMDWDIEPTAFNEYVTIQGSNGAANVLGVNRNGFADNNGPLTFSGAYTGDFVDAGPTDHGALFDFTFSPLAAGASQKFSIFYGASLNEASALSALGRVGAEVYSFGQSARDINGGTPGFSTFIFGFAGVGGTALPGVPEPATWALMILGMGAVGGAMRRRTAVKARIAFA